MKILLRQSVLKILQTTSKALNQHLSVSTFQQHRKMSSSLRLRDPNTLSNYDKYRITHTQVNLTIDFHDQILKGNVVHKIKAARKDESTAIILDTNQLKVQSVTIDGQNTDWELLPESKPYGRPLKISPGSAAGITPDFELSIGLQTTRKSTALQFMTPTQARSEHPYVFSQCQAINARSVFPCQDTPDVKSTFDFNIISPLPVIASGLPVEDSETAPESNEGKLYRFHQPIPIPSYLFAVSSGDIQQAPIGPRSVVATSPSDLKAAQWEFEKDTEHFIQAIEKIVYPYQWGTYNLLILPPSFPYGGMEHPQYTYCTPTVVSGDRENVDVVAHELSHSYSGNLVTAATWADFWLNEGWTTYLERRLQAALHGEPHRDFSAIIGWKALVDSVNDYGNDHEFTKLVPDMKGKDPDDAFSSVPYEKGYTFLSHLEDKVGRDKWNRFIPHYFTVFARKSIDSLEFKANLLEFFGDDSEALTSLKEVDWEKWYRSPGLPDKPKFDTSLADICYDLVSKWKNADPETFEPKPTDLQGWSANQIVVFLDEVLAFPTPLPKNLAQLMGKVYGFATKQNVEIVARYFRAALRSGDENSYEPAAKLLGQVGRMKFVRPLYKELNKVNRALALETFEKYKDFYHPICRGMIEKDLAA